jgi:pyrimidine deaminase RibD-like protein
MPSNVIPATISSLNLESAKIVLPNCKGRREMRGEHQELSEAEMRELLMKYLAEAAARGIVTFVTTEPCDPVLRTMVDDLILACRRMERLA